MTLDECAKTIQNYLCVPPLIILGSGCSAAYGLPTMNDLKNEIIKHGSSFSDQGFADFCVQLQGQGLETALDKSSLSQKSKEKIRSIIWEAVNSKDIDYLSKLTTQGTFPLADLFRKLLTPSPGRIVVVTTNYDRLAEYAADYANAAVESNFEGSLIKEFVYSNPSLVKRRIQAREKTVRIIKVHGSLDWFSQGTEILSFPYAGCKSPMLQPLIIPPSHDKHIETREDPYRTLISEADSAFREASSYLCIGYGFNDEHIQPILLREIRRGKPIVVVAKKMTNACLDILSDNAISKKIILESGDVEVVTRITREDGSESLEKGSFWKLDCFIKTFLEGST